MLPVPLSREVKLPQDGITVHAQAGSKNATRGRCSPLTFSPNALTVQAGFPRRPVDIGHALSIGHYVPNNRPAAHALPNQTPMLRSHADNKAPGIFASVC